MSCATASWTPPVTASTELLRALTVDQLFDAIAIRVNGPRAWDEVLTIDWDFTDLGEVHRTTLRNGVFTHRRRHDEDEGRAGTAARMPSSN